MSSTTAPNRLDPQVAQHGLVRSYSLEMTVKDVEELEASARLMPAQSGGGDRAMTGAKNSRGRSRASAIPEDYRTE